MFDWESKEELWTRPRPWKLYWIITGSITGVLVAGFLSWFLILELIGKPEMKSESENRSMTSGGEDEGRAAE